VSSVDTGDYTNSETGLKSAARGRASLKEGRGLPATKARNHETYFDFSRTATTEITEATEVVFPGDLGVFGGGSEVLLPRTEFVD
jgi:hypothetical protein